MRRVLVVGMTGAGKTTAARRLARVIDAPFHEMDALAIGPHWSTSPNLVPAVERIVAEPAWVFDSYGYEPVRDAMWAGADTIVWLDYPVHTIVPRVLRRSLARSFGRTPVFGGNVETWRGWLSGGHPVWWAIRMFRARRRYLATRTAASEHLHVVRLLRPRDFEVWLRTATERRARG